MKALWLLAILALIALAYVIPYGLLSDTPSFGGSFLIWTLFGILIAVWVGLAVKRWVDKDKGSDT